MQWKGCNILSSGYDQIAVIDEMEKKKDQRQMRLCPKNFSPKQKVGITIIEFKFKGQGEKISTKLGVDLHDRAIIQNFTPSWPLYDQDLDFSPVI